ncbi:DNA-directed RNA polymerase iii subunit rpc4 [Anaeramoeba ignava]|uniref:DNA-directed RNA polymerase iii subunit rpc4 n=1 Tax=Anaeramoeba ignava TaxID=1746090 RepID=A0A9Q0L935_ANAIG|nr:DNA-directed RNA polymerase iii subunit rpc4 [Anaeramoeba ignava]
MMDLDEDSPFFATRRIRSISKEVPQARLPLNSIPLQIKRTKPKNHSKHQQKQSNKNKDKETQITNSSEFETLGNSSFSESENQVQMQQEQDPQLLFQPNLTPFRNQNQGKKQKTINEDILQKKLEMFTKQFEKKEQINLAKKEFRTKKAQEESEIKRATFQKEVFSFGPQKFIERETNIIKEEVFDSHEQEIEMFGNIFEEPCKLPLLETKQNEVQNEKDLEEDFEEKIANDLFLDSDGNLLEKEMFWMQFPARMPFLFSTSNTLEQNQNQNENQNENLNENQNNENQNQNQNNQNQNQTINFNEIRKLKKDKIVNNKESGRIGSLYIHKSGKVRIKLGENILFSVNQGISPHNYQTGVLIDKNGNCCQVGDKFKKIVCYPNLNSMIEAISSDMEFEK